MVRSAGWQQAGGLDTFARARQRTQELLGGYTRPAIAIEHERELSRQMQSVATAAGMAHIPEAG
jgi:trimethylamine:corrinoid methyltransferase-like protein